MSYKTILISDDEAVRTITLNRPERRNAMTPEMQLELLAAAEEAVTSTCRIVMIKGAGEAFCSGLDLVEIQKMNDKTSLEHRTDAERFARLLLAVYELPKPTISVVHGAAVAGGTGLATVCDFTLAVPEARFGFTEVRIGFVPAIVSAFLALQVGDKRARDLLLTGRLFDATEAHRLGLVNELVAPENLESRVHAFAHSLAENSPESLSATKKLMADQNRAWLDAAIVHAMEANAHARETADFREGVAAFLEKRRAVWSKKG